MVRRRPPTKRLSTSAPSLTADTFIAGDLDDIRCLPLMSGRWLDSSDDLPFEMTFNPASADTWALGMIRQCVNELHGGQR